MKKIKAFFTNTRGLFRSLSFLFGEPKKSQVFYGYLHWVIAKKYANKRFKWYPYRDVMGKDQGIFPYDEHSLIVISPLEIKFLKKRKHIAHPKNYIKIFKRENLYKAS